MYVVLAGGPIILLLCRIGEACAELLAVHNGTEGWGGSEGLALH